MPYNISIFFDQRNEKLNGLHPVKLRVYSKYFRKAKLYSLGIDLTEKQFNQVWIEQQKNLKGKNKELRAKILKFQAKAEEDAKDMTNFSFDQFEKKYFRKTSDANNVFYHFEKVIKDNFEKNKIGTSESYKYTLKSFKDFANNKGGAELTKLSFTTITPDWLNKYEDFMVSKGKSITTIAIYTRTLRVIFNNAIEDGDISNDLYPFGKKKYQIPETKKVKKALTGKQLATLFKTEPLTIEQIKAKDFWFFSYACNGMNPKDICLLKYSDIKDGKFSYYRAKTFNKSRTKEKIEIYINDFTNSIIEKYGNEKKDGYVFPMLQIKESELKKYSIIKNFTRAINQHLKVLAKNNGLPEELSSYWARHSFATNSIRNGASLEFISEALNHSDLSVTKAYFAGFEEETKKEFSDKLMDF